MRYALTDDGVEFAIGADQMLFWCSFKAETPTPLLERKTTSQMRPKICSCGCVRMRSSDAKRMGQQINERYVKL